MLLPAVPPQSWDDLALNFQSLQSVLSKPSAQPLAFPQLLTAKQVAIAYGTATLTYPGGSPVSGVTTVTHGIGRVPVVVIGGDQGGAAFISSPETFTYTTTTFRVNCHTADGTSPAAAATQTIGWIAIG